MSQLQFERFVAQRFMPAKEKGFAHALSRIAVVGIALGVTVMVMSVSILRGFQHDIADKVSGFGSHLTVRAYEVNPMYGSESPVVADSTLMEMLRNMPGVASANGYANKGGMVKTADQIYGIMMRGVSCESDTTFFASCLTDGRMPQGDNEVLISTTIASRLRLGVGDKMRSYFWQGENYRQRAFAVVGTYNTDLTEMDEVYVIGTLHAVQRLNDWGDSMVGGIEIAVDNMKHLETTARRVMAELPYSLTVHTIVDDNPALFSWLDLLNSNITLILTIMCLVCAVAIVSTMLIMIFEKGATIGLLKALGASRQSVKRIFVQKAAGLTLRGVVVGEVVALLLSLAQRRWQLVQLDPESYSMTHVPVEMDVMVYATVAIGVVAICIAALLLPAAYISRIDPATTMRTER